MIKAAGILIAAPDGKALFLKRGAGSDHPFEWSFPGGQAEGDETAEGCAVRETIEEIGFLPAGDRAVWTRSISPVMSGTPEGAATEPPAPEQVDFTTFIQRTPETFLPRLSDEHTAYAWADPADPPQPLHPGAQVALARLTMDELGVARAIAAGLLTSPQKYMNVWLFAIRITGTGYAYRSERKEHVWRDSSLYLNDEFLARCNGLAVIWVHPEKKPILDSKEYAKRSIGSIMLPYIQGDEVWGIAKIYDQEAAEEMATSESSTSPGVVLKAGESTTLKNEDGSPLLVEGGIDLLDHIAIVPYGVWDKGGDPAGVLNHSLNERADSMAEETEAEKKAREDAARRDAHPGEEPDKLLAKLDAMQKRMDAMEAADKARRDAEEEKERKDAAARRDAEREEWMKADAEACERDDADEKAECEEIEKGGEPKEVAADKARKSRKDRMKARADAAEAMEDKAKKDAAEKAAREDAARKDADAKAEAARADAARTDSDSLRKLMANLPKAPTDADYAAMLDAQHRADAEAYQPLALRAPGPLQGETLTAYRVRLARGVQKHSKDWSGVDLHALQDAALNIAESRIYADAALASHSTDGMPEDVLIPRSYTNPDTGHRITEFRGRHTFIHGLKRPSLRATEFLTGKGR